MTRRDARKTALGLLYEQSFHSDEELQSFYEFTTAEQETEDNEYVKKLLFGAVENISAIDDKIKENAVGWKFERLSRMSLSIMRICIYEMLFTEDVPYNIAINEAVELAKTYDHDKAPKFINGVLNMIAEKEGLKAKQ